MQIIFFILFITPFSGMAQNIQLSGSVFDTNNEPVVAASVIEKGTAKGVVTDFDGNFSLNVSPNATIVISYVGYITQEIKLNGRETLYIILEEDVEMLEELVVVGYGSLKKE